MSILPSDEAAALISHYLRQLAERAGVRWTDANDRDMARLSTLLDQAGAEPALDTIPPFRPTAPPQLDTRVTQTLDQDAAGWQDFRRWQAERAIDERVDQAHRMVSRRR
jgi:hypothetical protein